MNFLLALSQKGQYNNRACFRQYNSVLKAFGSGVETRGKH